MSLYVEIKKTLPGFRLAIQFEGAEERIALLGASGSGKSMTLRCIAGLIAPDEGKIIVNGSPFFDSKKGINRKPQARKTGFLFQNYALFPHLNVTENIAFGITALGEAQRKQRVCELMEKFHLKGLENRYPGEISGGQQQRTALARAIAADPEILLLDEPFSALDDYLRSHMLKEMLEFLKEYKGTTLVVTHNMEEAYRLCDKILVLGGGSVHAFGNKQEVLYNPVTSEAARITGCKNIVRAQRKEAEHIEIPSWNMKVKTNSTTKTKKGYCGIRANHIQYSTTNNSENTFKARIVGNIETPFRQTIYLKFEGSNRGPLDYDIQWEISKETWDLIDKDSGMVHIHLPEDKIMYFEE